MSFVVCGWGETREAAEAECARQLYMTEHAMNRLGAFRAAFANILEWPEPLPEPRP